MFSFQERAQQLNGIAQTDYDLVIIGGGITGCGIALDAASRETGRNLKILLLEKGDFANGTSSRSTKLIHGGLRYLKNFEFKLVYEVGREREILHQNARHLVLAEKMLLPILKAGSLGKFTTGIGLRLYDFLAGVKYEERRKMLNKEETIQEEKLLKRAPIIGGGLYYEYRTDDARLTMDVLKTACIKYHAKALNYAR
ncbi:MAG: FAD-dependent oxidoreductase [Bacteroidetes bacterium]|nr:FAD-dependent oxidoreductase [Bacteroidota bacterium]